MAGPPAAVAAVRRAVRATLADLPPGSLVLVACSGGADSLALAAAAAFCAPRSGRRAGLVTVDHALQAGSAGRAEAVADWARAAGLDPVVVATVDARGPGGPEAAARRARYAALAEAARSSGAVAVLLGHTRDDQAETVLLGLARGSGARSLAGMASVRGIYRRPLLDLPRRTTEAACAAAGLAPWTDPHNADPAFARVRVRAALAVLEDALGPALPAALARTARLLRADADLLDDLAGPALAAARAGGAGLGCATLAGLPLALRSRVLREAATEAGAAAGALAASHVDALDALVVGWRGQGPVALPGGLRAERVAGRLKFTHSAHVSPQSRVSRHPVTLVSGDTSRVDGRRAPMSGTTGDGGPRTGR